MELRLIFRKSVEITLLRKNLVKLVLQKFLQHFPTDI